MGRREAVRVADPVASGINLAMAALAPVRDGAGPDTAPASPACSRRPTGGLDTDRRYVMAYGHAERNLVLIVAVTGADQIVQALSGFAGQQQPGRHPGTLGSDIG